MKYDKLTTKNHNVSKQYLCCLEDFNKIVHREDDELKNKQIPQLVSDVEVLNLDCAEEKRCDPNNIQRNKTMDIAFAISDSLNIEILLVEFRFNYINPYNMKKGDLEGKVSGSKSILGNSVKINDNYIFIFKPNLIQQARNRMHKMNPKIPNNYIVMDLDGLVRKYLI